MACTYIKYVCKSTSICEKCFFQAATTVSLDVSGVEEDDVGSENTESSFKVATSNNNDDDLDNLYFELSDMSNF